MCTTHNHNNNFIINICSKSSSINTISIIIIIIIIIVYTISIIITITPMRLLGAWVNIWFRVIIIIIIIIIIIMGKIIEHQEQGLDIKMPLLFIRSKKSGQVLDLQQKNVDGREEDGQCNAESKRHEV